MLNVLVPKEVSKEETRVAATPETLKKIAELGLKVFVEAKAGDKSYFSDEAYKEAGAEIKSEIEELYNSADIVLSVNAPGVNPENQKHQLDMVKENSCWISMLTPQSELDLIKKMVDKKITCFSMNLIPRISRAQKMDALTSQSNIAGYKAVIMAAEKLGKLFPLLMTASGTIHPARVLIMGAGVAGLQAIATARRLGAQVEASDIRPAVKEQVESLGAKFIGVVEESAEDKSGYAKEASKEFLEKQAKEVSKRIAKADVVITTALILGKKAPVLVTEEMVMSMKKGSVIVDLAAEQGGNCKLTVPGEVVVKHGITIIGTLNMPATVPVHSTEMYAKNILNFLLGIIKDGKLNIDMEDEVVKGALLTHEGKVLHEPTAKLLGDAK
jgi:NAD(P) transhydrogenase subunit alpha